jgi:hypothetical protein
MSDPGQLSVETGWLPETPRHQCDGPHVRTRQAALDAEIRERDRWSGGRRGSPTDTKRLPSACGSSAHRNARLRVPSDRSPVRFPRVDAGGNGVPSAPNMAPDLGTFRDPPSLIDALLSSGPLDNEEPAAGRSRAGYGTVDLRRRPRQPRTDRRNRGPRGTRSDRRRSRRRALRVAPRRWHRRSAALFDARRRPRDWSMPTDLRFTALTATPYL